MNTDFSKGLDPRVQHAVLRDSQFEASRRICLIAELTATAKVSSVEVLEHNPPKREDQGCFLKFSVQGGFAEPGVIQKHDGSFAKSFTMIGTLSYFLAGDTMLGDADFEYDSFQLT